MITLYTIDCPRCLVLEKKLNNKGIIFTKITEFDKDKFLQEGFTSAPILEVDGTLLDYKKAVEWINDHKEEL